MHGSKRTKTRPDRLSAIDLLTKEVHQEPRTIGMIILAAAAFITHNYTAKVSQATNTMANYYQSRMIAYKDYLGRNLDGNRKSNHPLVQVYITSKANNEVHTLKEMKSEVHRYSKKKIGNLFPAKR